MLTPEILNRIAELRAKMADGTITLEELRQGVILMRENRVTAQAEASTTRSAKKKLSSTTVADMEAELGLL
jgi:hypothetical protein